MILTTALDFFNRYEEGYEWISDGLSMELLFLVQKSRKPLFLNNLFISLKAQNRLEN